MSAPSNDKLDIESTSALSRYLVERGSVARGEADRLTIAVLQGGVSSRTVRVDLPSGERWVLKQALARLRVPVDWFADPARTHHEAQAMVALAGICPAGSVPRLVFEDEGQHLLAMEAVAEPHENWKAMLLRGDLEEGHVRQFGELLGSIHCGGYRERARLGRRFEDRGYFQTLRLEPYYSFSAEQVPQAAGFLKGLIERTNAVAVTLVHGDYSPKNILVRGQMAGDARMTRDGRLVLLDHEVLHYGDPAFDLGFSLTHLLSKAHHVAPLRGPFADAARLYWETYSAEVVREPWTDGLEARAVEHTIGCLLARVAGRSQLEYLAPAERARQRRVAVELGAAPPARVPELIQQFIARITALEERE